MVLATFLLQLAAIYVPFLDEFFQVVPLAIDELLAAMGLGLFVFIMIELEKRRLPRGRNG
jgi:Ca2+-transporting ATPase